MCRIFDMFRTQTPDGGDLVFVSMEMLRGETLSHRIASRKRLDVDEAVPLVEQMAHGLDAAHRAGIVHRDFKSSNVMLVPESGSPGGCRAVVTDFGLAQRFGDGTSSLTETGKILGSPAYMAPEQVLGESVTEAADVYAFGVVLYEMVTGTRPFQADTPMGVALKRVQSPPPDPAIARPDLPGAWTAAITRCMARSPAERFSSLSEVVAALRAPAAPPTAHEVTAAVPALRRRPWLSPRVAAFSLLLLLASGWATWRTRQFDSEERARIGHSAPREPERDWGRVVLAVAPIQPVSPEAATEAEVMRQLLYQSLSGLVADTASSRVDVILTEGGPAPRTPKEAEALLRKAGANALIWGHATTLGGETTFEPKIARRAPIVRQWTRRAVDDSGNTLIAEVAALQASAGQRNALGIRKAKAKDVAALVVSLIASDLVAALPPPEALAILQKVDTPESLWHQARAWMQKDTFLIASHAEIQQANHATARSLLDRARAMAPDRWEPRYFLGESKSFALELSAGGSESPLGALAGLRDLAGGCSDFDAARALGAPTRLLAWRLAQCRFRDGRTTEGLRLLADLSSDRDGLWATRCLEWLGDQPGASAALASVKLDDTDKWTFKGVIDHGGYALVVKHLERRPNLREDPIPTFLLSLAAEQRDREFRQYAAEARAWVTAPGVVGAAVARVRWALGFPTLKDRAFLEAEEPGTVAATYSVIDVAEAEAIGHAVGGRTLDMRKAISVLTVRGNKAEMRHVDARRTALLALADWLDGAYADAARRLGDEVTGEAWWWAMYPQPAVVSYLAAARAGLPADTEARRLGLVRNRETQAEKAANDFQSPAYPLRYPPSPEAAFVDVLRGAVSEEEALQVVSPFYDGRSRWNCALQTYLGEARLIRGDKVGGRKFLERAVATGIKHERAWLLARADLARLDAGS